MKIKQKIAILFAGLFLIFSYQNCSEMNSTDSESEKAQVSNSGQGFTEVMDKVLKPQCIGCHSSFYPAGNIDLSTYAAIIDSGTVVPGETSLSSLYTSMANKEMPPEYPAPAASIAMVAQWINNGAKDANGTAAIIKPEVNAGTDFYIYEPENSITLQGEATVKGATISKITWSQLSGPKDLNIASPNSLTSEVTGITVGNYEFELLVETDKGGIASDTVKLTLNPFNNALPTVGAGLDVNIQPPTTTASITAIAADPDGSITQYNWSQTSGPASLSLSGTTNATLNVSNITIQGTYGFEITVTDNDGATASDQVNIVLDPAPVAQSFQDINMTIFIPKCLNCHQGNNARGGYDMSNYNLIMSLVVVNNANASELYKRCYDDTMPPGRPLTKAEKDKIRDWINTGAPNN